MKKTVFVIIVSFLASCWLCAQTEVERWGRFETSLKAEVKGNPFDVQLTAVFTDGKEKIEVRGFYDGDSCYKLRFMPRHEGEWSYVTRSNVPELNRRRGSFVCTPPSEGNHGPVQVSPENGRAFGYADGTVFHPIGTTSYSWIHQSADRRERTFASLAEAGFNKVRMCVFPMYNNLCGEEPDIFPFVRDGDGFDLSRPDPEFYGRLEDILDRLSEMGIQADLILFHPYDGHWGFEALGMDENLRYLDYLQARLSSFRNVWWSLANEYDYCTTKSMDDWKVLIDRVCDNDPYSHLRSIHGSTATYYPYAGSRLTHASIQDEGPVEDFGRASIVHNIYDMPVVFDEVCYEGNLVARWGRLSGPEMLHRIWQGLLAGVYVTHGECLQFEEGNRDEIFFVKGGLWRGESWKRIAFTRALMDGLSRPLELADTSRDHKTATDGEGNYYVYFGMEVADSWTFSLPAKCAAYPKAREGARYRVEIIDTWNMTVSEYPGIFELGELRDYRHYDTLLRSVRLPAVPYLLLRISEVD